MADVIDKRKANGVKPPRHAHGRDQILEVAETEAREWLGVSFQEALEQLDRGELEGTVAEAEFRSLRRLLES